MTSKMIEIIWGGEVVGFIADPKPDMFHLYGKWLPAATEKGAEFRALLESLTREEVDVVNVLIGAGDLQQEGEASLYSKDWINILVKPQPEPVRILELKSEEPGDIRCI